MKKLTYFHTLYKRNVTEIICDDFEIREGFLFFKSLGHKCAIELKYVVSLENVEE